MPAERPEDLSAHLSIPVVLIEVDHSGSEADDDGISTAAMAGYELLPSEPILDSNSDSESNVDERNDQQLSATEEQVTVDVQVPSENQLDSTALQEARSVHVTSSDFPTDDNSRPETLAMSSEQADMIKACMAKIVLPESSHPSWASLIPEDQWKKHLLSKLRDEKF